MRLIDRYTLPPSLLPRVAGPRFFFVSCFLFRNSRLMIWWFDTRRHGRLLGSFFCARFLEILDFTLPMGVCRRADWPLATHVADSELIAMSALGFGRRRLLVPIGMLPWAQPDHF